MNLHANLLNFASSSVLRNKILALHLNCPLCSLFHKSYVGFCKISTNYLIIFVIIILSLLFFTCEKTHIDFHLLYSNQQYQCILFIMFSCVILRFPILCSYNFIRVIELPAVFQAWAVETDSLPSIIVEDSELGPLPAQARVTPESPTLCLLRPGCWHGLS